MAKKKERDEFTRRMNLQVARGDYDALWKRKGKLTKEKEDD